MRVTLLDTMGGDLTVVNAARVSFRKTSTALTARDEKLIKYLADHNHWTPFAHVMVQLRISAPFFVARQWFRHTVGFARNEVSRRYVDDDPVVWTPEHWRARPDASIKQGSGAIIADDAHIRAIYAHAIAVATEAYHALLEAGVAPEQARAPLPIATYTEWIETASLYAYARLVRERRAPGAQQETADIAELIANQCAIAAPCSWAALCSNIS